MNFQWNFIEFHGIAPPPWGNRHGLTSRALWGARAGLSEAAAGLSEAVKALLDGDDAGGGDIFVDPRDPGKWVQQEDTVFRDGVFFALVVTILWTFAKALVEIEKLNF